jgi:phage terminase small subunit
VPRQSIDALSLPRVDGRPPPLRAPATVVSESREVFTELVPSVAPDHFRPGELPLLSAYCDLVVLRCQAVAGLREEGVVVGGKVSPWLAVLDRCNRSLVPLAKALRLSPSSRTDPKTVARGKPAFDADGLIASLGSLEGGDADWGP